MLTGVTYDKISDEGLHISLAGKSQILDVDHIIICAGQTSEDSLEHKLSSAGLSVHKVGGAHVAAELDAKQAINEASRLAATI